MPEAYMPGARPGERSPRNVLRRRSQEPRGSMPPAGLVGTPIGMADYLIAGICLARGARLLVRNRSHFERVPGLELAEI